ncbi:MAG: glycosyl hydrolase family 28-related protein [Pirellulales bacterium]
MNYQCGRRMIMGWVAWTLCVGLVHAEPQCGANLMQVPAMRFPESPAVIDVSRPPYLARGDGRTDDTESIQKALNDAMGQRRVVYFPRGTYLVSRTLRWSKQHATGVEAWGFNWLQGEHAESTVIRLADRVCTDPKQSMAIMWCGGFGSADWFHNYVQGLTFDAGAGNPGAIGLQFYSNNSGAVRDCRFTAQPESGSIGLDLGHTDMNGPLLVSNCEVKGFSRGIRTAGGVNSQTFENVTLEGQTDVGLDNEGQTISVRTLSSVNRVPSVRSYGTLCLIDSELRNPDPKSSLPAIVNYNQGRIFVRDVTAMGYSRSLIDVKSPDWASAVNNPSSDAVVSLGSTIEEYSSHPATVVFGQVGQSLRLAVATPPEVAVDSPDDWANVDKFGADPSGQHDSSAAIQSAIDSGATTVFFPGNYALASTVVIRGNVRRLVGIGGWIDYDGRTQPDFRIADGTSSNVVMEHLANVHGGLEIDTARTVVLRSIADCDLTFTSRSAGGTLFLEDVVTHSLRPQKMRVWARQLNVENEGTHIQNTGGNLWILGLKTERGGTLIETLNGGQTEVLGGFSYTTTAGKLGPMFVNEDSSVFTFFNEVCYNNDPFAVLIRERRGTEVREVRAGHGSTAPYAGTGK